MKLSCTFLLLFLSFQVFSKDEIIYSVGHDIPMGYQENEGIQKNYYITMGSDQGIQKGAILDVFRILTQQNFYDKQKRVNYKIKIGSIKIIETTSQASIAVSHQFKEGSEQPILDVKNFMVGDVVAIHVND